MNILRCLTAGSMLMLAVSAHAQVTWDIEGAKLSDGSALTGSFVYNATTNTYSHIDIVAEGKIFDILDSGPFINNGNLASLNVSSGNLTNDPVLAMFFTPVLTNAGGTASFYTGASSAGTSGYGPCYNAACSLYTPMLSITTGKVVSAPEIDPTSATSALALLAGGLAVLSGRKRLGVPA